MLRLNEGRDYTIYRIYIAVGLGALVGGPILAALILGGDFAYAEYGRAYLSVLTGWIAGILLYWWWVFLVKDRREHSHKTPIGPDTTPPISSLRNLNSLHQALIIHSRDIEAWGKARWSETLPVLEFFGWLNALVVWILGFVWASMLDILPGVDPVLVPVGVLVIMATLLLRMWFLVRRSAEGYGEAYLKPLGLEVEQAPTLKLNLRMPAEGQAVLPEGPAIVVGSRRGHPIRIEILDNHMRTLVQASAPDFRLRSLDGKLEAEDGATEALTKAIRLLRKARRWRGIRVQGGPDGISIERQSRSQNMWLYDLWLAEYLVAHLG